MTRAFRRALLLSLTLTLAAAIASAADLTGTWTGNTDAPDIGTIQVTLILKKAEDGYAGTVSDSASLIAPDTPVRDLKVEGDSLTCWFNLADGSTVSMQLKVSGETMTGGWQHSDGGTGAISLERKK